VSGPDTPTLAEQLGSGPATRSLAAVLRSQFTTRDDTVRLLAVTTGAPVASGDAGYNRYQNIVVAGQLLRAPFIASAAMQGVAAGTPCYALATRTTLLIIGKLN
jgi:hypothetical protein